MGMREEKLYSAGKAAKVLGIHFNTMKKWIYAGKVKVIKTLGGQYRIPESEIRKLLGVPTPKNQVIVYARVSSEDQKEDLKHQREMLQKYVRKGGYKTVAIFEDVASGLKDDRRGLRKVFDALLYINVRDFRTVRGPPFSLERPRSSGPLQRTDRTCSCS